MEKIKDILRENAGKFVSCEVYYRASRRDRPESYKYIDEIPVPSIIHGDDVDLLDLWAYDWDLYDEEEYYQYIDDSDVCRDYFEDLCKEGGRILIIWLSNLSYDILSDPSIQKVGSIRMSNLGAFQQLIVVRNIRENSHHYNDDFDDCDDSEDYDYECECVDKCIYELVDGSPKRLDNYFARQSVLVGEEKFKSSFASVIECPEDAAWWENESFEEHFGISDAKILVVILA